MSILPYSPSVPFFWSRPMPAEGGGGDGSGVVMLNAALVAPVTVAVA